MSWDAKYNELLGRWEEFKKARTASVQSEHTGKVGNQTGVTHKHLNEWFADFEVRFDTIVLDKESWHATPMKVMSTCSDRISAVSTTIRQLASQNDEGKIQAHLETMQAQFVSMLEYTRPIMVEIKLIRFLNDKNLSSIIDRYFEIHSEIPNLKKRLEVLLGGATIATLTKEFRKRRNVLGWKTVIFGVILVAICGGAICYGWHTFTDLESIIKTGDTIKSVLIIIVRFAVFVPFYLALSFIWQQYLRERKIEEEYGFRAAVSAILPSLSELIKDEAKHREITDVALKEVFKPIEPQRAEEPSPINLKTLEQIAMIVKGK